MEVNRIYKDVILSNLVTEDVLNQYFSNKIFNFTDLWLQASSNVLRGVGIQEMAKTKTKTKTIMIIDDDQVFHDLYAEMLEENDYRLVHVYDGDEA